VESLPILVGTDDGVHHVADGSRLLTGHAVDHLVAGSDGVWAVAGDAVWHLTAPGGPGIVAGPADVRLNCVLPAGDRLLAGAAGAALFEVDDPLRRVESFERTPGRDAWYTPWGGPPDVRSMARGPDGTLYVNVHVGGVVRSTDGGSTWEDTMDIHADVHQVIADLRTPGHAYAATARGLAETTDAAGSWVFSTEGLHASYCRAVATSREWLFLSASQGSRGRRAALYRRTLGGGPFERCEAGLPGWFSTNLDTFCLAVKEALVAAGDADGTVYVSGDHGSTWAVAASGLGEIRCLAIA
jgi:hypothetical protein